MTGEFFFKICMVGPVSGSYTAHIFSDTPRKTSRPKNTKVMIRPTHSLIPGFEKNLSRPRRDLRYGGLMTTAPQDRLEKADHSPVWPLWAFYYSFPAHVSSETIFIAAPSARYRMACSILRP